MRFESTNDNPCLPSQSSAWAADLNNQAFTAAKTGIALADALVVGSAKAFADEAVHKPERLAQGLVGAAECGITAGLLSGLRNPMINSALIAGGAVGTIVYAQDVGRRVASDTDLKQAIERAAEAKTLDQYCKSLSAVEGAAGKYGSEIATNLVAGSAGFYGGSRVAQELKFAGNGSRFAFASINCDRIDTTMPGLRSDAQSNKQAGLLFSKRFNYENGESLQMNDDGTATFTNTHGETQHLKHKSVSNDLELLYRPHDDPAKTLNSVRMVDSKGGQQPNIFVNELLNSKDATSVIKNLPGKLEPEWCTHRMIELRTANGEALNIKHAYERPDSPFLLQRFSAVRAGSYEVEKLPAVTRPFTSYKHVEAMLNRIEAGGWYTTDADWRNFGVKNGLVVSTNPDSRCWIDSRYGSRWEELDHFRAAQINQSLLPRLRELYGKGHPIIAITKARISMHQNELGDELYSEAGNDKVIKELANSGQYYAASEYAQSLFFKHRDLSNCGTNDAEIQKAMKYFDLSQKYLAKHYDLDN